jgi:hypothetical protein
METIITYLITLSIIFTISYALVTYDSFRKVVMRYLLIDISVIAVIIGLIATTQ